MRKIKFRGKAKMSIEELNDMYFEHDNGWFYGNLVMYGDTPYIVGDFIEVDQEYTVNEFWVAVHPESVGQFTGLKDKNGKEIYEGDVLKTHDQNNVIKYQHGSFMLIGLHEDRYERNYSRLYHYLIDSTIPNMEGSRFDGVTTTLEVIGNIYEDKHLLKEESK